MSTPALLDKQGKNTGKSHDLESKIFGLEPNTHLLYLSKVLQEANQRQGTAHTKTRTEVRGGGAKPWKQKGTGRARAGSNRSPLWRGGGIMHGPRNNVNWTKKMNKKDKALSLISAINFVNNASRLSVMEELNIEEAKTKAVAAIIAEAGFAGQNVLFIVNSANAQLALLKRASKNLVGAKVISTEELNVKDILKADQVIATKAAISEIEERFEAFAKEKAAA